jgi:membrane protease YdiL (CAAX protease family)
MQVASATETIPLGDSSLLLGWGLAGLAVTASALVGWLIWRRVGHGHPFVPGHPWPVATWNGLEVFLIAFCWLVVCGVFVSLVPAAPLLDRMAAQAAGSIVATMLLVALLHLHGVSWRSIGLTSDDASLDWRLAIAALVLVTGPLLVVAAGLDRIVAYEHPVIDGLTGDQGWVAVAIVAITAVIAAPISEEFFFRRILLGWLDARFPSPGGRVAILVSAVAFGLSHLGQGLAWLPLVGLGVVLGELAYRRGSIVPAILLHALFNAVSVLILVLQIAAGQTRGG